MRAEIQPQPGLGQSAQQLAYAHQATGIKLLWDDEQVQRQCDQKLTQHGNDQPQLGTMQRVVKHGKYLPS